MTNDSNKEGRKLFKGVEYISLSEAATSTPYSQEYLSLLARRKKFKARKLGRNWYVTRDALAAYLATKIDENIADASQFSESFPRPMAERAVPEAAVILPATPAPIASPVSLMRRMSAGIMVGACAFVFVFFFGGRIQNLLASIASFVPSSSPAGTMYSLSDIYGAIAGTFDASPIPKDQNGSLIQQLKYVESNLGWASGSNDIWNLNSGNVGIGTTTPNYTLAVAGAASISNGIYGSGLTTCSGNQFLHWDAGTGTFSCGTAAGSGGSAIGVRAGSGTFTHVTSISFDAGAFDISNIASESLVKLDYTNGPASRSIAQTITGAWDFTAASNQFSNTLEIEMASISVGILNAASVSNNFEVRGVASASQTYGAGLTSCTGKLLWSNGTFSCGTDQVGGGGSTLDLREGYSGSFTTKSELSFNSDAFNLDLANPDARLSLDYINGPASRAMSNAWTGLNIFSAGASVSAGNFEVVGIASISDSIIASESWLRGYGSSPRANLRLGSLTNTPTFPAYEVRTFDNTAASASLEFYSYRYATDVRFERAGGTGDRIAARLLHLADCCGTATSTFDLYNSSNSSNLVKVRLNAQGNSYFTGGNVGIGTATPTTKLEVSGSASVSANFEVSGTASISRLFIGGIAFRPITSNSLDFDEFANAMTLDANTSVASNGYTFSMMGNTGIGTLTPGATLELKKTTNSTTVDMMRLRNDGTGTNAGSSINFYNNATNTGFIKSYYSGQWLIEMGSGTTGSLGVLNAGTAFIKNNGANNTKLNIYTTAAGAVGNTAELLLGPSSGFAAGTVSPRIYGYQELIGGDSGLRFDTYTPAGRANRVVISASGLVGIGTKSPAALLDVTATTSFGGDLFNVSSSTAGFFRIKNNGNVRASGSFQIEGNITGESNASISQNFEVSGTASVSQLYIGGTLYAPSVATPFLGIDFGVSGGTPVKITSLSFDANMFDVSNLASAGFVKLDWTNGPASRSTQNTWSALNIFSAGASFSNGEFTGYASASKTFGSGLTTCTGAQFLHWDATSGTFSCGTPATASGGSAVGLREGYSAAFTNKTSISFDAGAFNLDLANADARLSLDYVNGPASRSIAQTISGAWNFTTNPTFTSARLVTSNSLDFDEFANTMTLDAGLTISSATNGINWTHTTFTNAAGNISMWTNDAGYLTTISSESFWDTAYNYSQIGHLPLAGGTLTGNLIGTNASFSANLEVTGAASSYQLFGSGLSTCTGKLLWSNGTFSCGVDQTNTGTLTSIAVRENGGAFTHITSISFDAGAFNISNIASESLVKLDYTNGPASRAMQNTWSALNIFSAGASFSNGEFTGYASASQYYGAGLTTCNGSNFLQWSGGIFGCAAGGAGGRPASNSLDWDEFANAMTLDANTTIASNGYTLGFTGNLSIGNTATPLAKLFVEGSTAASGANAVGAIYASASLTNSTASGFQFGNRFLNTVNGTVAGTEDGMLVRMIDNTTLANTVRGLEVQAYSGTNTAGTNVGVVAFGKTIGIQGVTDALAGGVTQPAAVFADLDNGSAPTIGNALRAYTDNATSANLVQFYQETSAYTGTGLLMNLGNNGGSFTGKFFDLQKIGTSKMVVTSSGFVGIGTSSPTDLLTVASTGFDGNLLLLRDSDGRCEHNPEAGSETVACSSDERLKTDIVDATSAVEYLNGFRVREYTVRASGDRLVGVIAQELLETHPELVTTGSDGYLMVEQPSVWQLVKGFQELASAQLQLEETMHAYASVSVTHTVMPKASDILAMITDAAEIVARTIRVTGDVISNGIKKTYFTLADLFPGQDVGALVQNWSSRTITIDNRTTVDASAQPAAQSKVDLSPDNTSLATYGVDSTRGEIQLSGTSELVSGEAKIFFDFSFTSIIASSSPIRVFIMPTTGAVQGPLYVEVKNQYGFTVKERGSTSAGTFDWLVIARRKGYENTSDMVSTPTPSAVPTPSIAPTPTATPLPTETPTITDTSTPTTEPSTTPEVSVEPTPEPTIVITPEVMPTPVDIMPTPEATPATPEIISAAPAPAEVVADTVPATE